MIIWFALLIPLAVAAVLFFGFRRSVTWWELLAPLGVSLLLVTCFKLGIETAQTTDREYWGGWAVKAQYYEDWNQRVSCSHRRTNGKGQFIGYEHLYDVVYHGPYWQVIDSNGLIVGISQGRFNTLVRQFGNKQFVELHRSYHTNDGDMFQAVWDGNPATQEPVTTEHRYVNKVKASSSVFKFDKVNPKMYGLYDYPRIHNWYELPSILGTAGPETAEANRRLTLWNAKLGAQKQVRIWILLFQNQPVQAGFEQENYWQGGNKNEFTLAIGIDSLQRVTWVHPISWTEVDALKVSARDYVAAEDTLDLVKTVEWLAPQVASQFVRKQFRDFNYLTVEPPPWAVAMTYLVTLLANIGVTIWVIRNEYE